MRYFYHLDSYKKGHWVTTNFVKEISYKDYLEILKKEQEIITESGLVGWHFPFEAKSVSENKVLQK